MLYVGTWVNSNGEQEAAIITKVWDHTTGMVNLVTYPEGESHTSVQHLVQDAANEKLATNGYIAY